jgi:hypothetical protein
LPFGWLSFLSTLPCSIHSRSRSRSGPHGSYTRYATFVYHQLSHMNPFNHSFHTFHMGTISPISHLPELYSLFYTSAIRTVYRSDNHSHGIIHPVSTNGSACLSFALLTPAPRAHQPIAIAPVPGIPPRILDTKTQYRA